MIEREKMFIISDDVDDSIRQQVVIFDVKVFKTFSDFERYIENAPIIINSLVISAKELQFNNTNMTRLINCILSPFLQITGSILYLIGLDVDIEQVKGFFATSSIDNVVVYQDLLTIDYIVSMCTGEARSTEEELTYDITYRVRADEYIKKSRALQNADLEDIYETDEILMDDIPNEEEPEETRIDITDTAEVIYVCGDNRKPRTLFTFLLAQYISLNDKVVIIEHDTDYHLLTEFVTKSNIEYLSITVEDCINDLSGIIDKIKLSDKKLIIITCIKRIIFDYGYLFDILYSNTKNNVRYFIRECYFNEIPYCKPILYITENTIPDILELCSNLKYDVNENTVFVGLETSTIKDISLTSNEMRAIISKLLHKSNVHSEVFRITSLYINKDIYCFKTLLQMLGGAKL